MINNHMDKNTEIIEKDQNKEKPESLPNENGGFCFSSVLKITDPNTKEILVQIRGDN